MILFHPPELLPGKHAELDRILFQMFPLKFGKEIYISFFWEGIYDIIAWKRTSRFSIIDPKGILRPAKCIKVVDGDTDILFVKCRERISGKKEALYAVLGKTENIPAQVLEKKLKMMRTPTGSLPHYITYFFNLPKGRKMQQPKILGFEDETPTIRYLLFKKSEERGNAWTAFLELTNSKKVYFLPVLHLREVTDPFSGKGKISVVTERGIQPSFFTTTEDEVYVVERIGNDGRDVKILGGDEIYHGILFEKAERGMAIAFKEIEKGELEKALSKESVGIRGTLFFHFNGKDISVEKVHYPHIHAELPGTETKIFREITLCWKTGMKDTLYYAFGKMKKGTVEGVFSFILEEPKGERTREITESLFSHPDGIEVQFGRKRIRIRETDIFGILKEHIS